MELSIGSSNVSFTEALGNLELECPEHMTCLEGAELQRALKEQHKNMYIIAAGLNPESRVLELVTANLDILTLECDESIIPMWYEGKYEVFPALGGKKLVIASEKHKGTTVILDSSRVIERASKGYKLSA